MQTHLTVVPKIIEKTICIETQEYLDKNGPLYKYQSGFLPKFSADSCATYGFYFERNGHRISHWDDPSWPTKSVWHVRPPVLLQKMEYVGFKESVIKWFQLFLSNRNFFVPQGCISGPLDLLIYKNDLPQALDENGSYLYAEVSCILYHHKGCWKNRKSIK